MSIIDVKSALCDVLEKTKLTLDNQSVIGHPIEVTPAITIIPLIKVTMGILSSGAEIDNGKKLNISDTPIAAVGGGVTYAPQGFLIVNNDTTTILKVNGDNGGEKWIDMLSGVVQDLLNK